MLPDRRCLVSINPYTNYTLKIGKRLLFKNTDYKRCPEEKKKCVSVIFFVSVSRGEKKKEKPGMLLGKS